MTEEKVTEQAVSKIPSPSEILRISDTPEGQDEESAVLPQIREMMRAGLVYGRKTSKTHPRMKKFIAANRNGLELIDLEKTLILFEQALAVIRDTVRKNGTILFADTDPGTRDLVENIAKDFEYPFVIQRWLGGTLTNIKMISSRLAVFTSMKEGRAKGEFDKYTKKERLMVDRKLERMEMLFGGIQGMASLPHLIFVVNSRLHETAIREAKICNIPVVAVMNTDADPETVAYPIPANDGSREGMTWILERVRLAIEEGQRDRIATSETDSSSENQSVVQ